jgi:hypothetical protein
MPGAPRSPIFGKLEEPHGGLSFLNVSSHFRSFPLIFQVGDFRITGDKIVKKIESNKLRFVYDRRPCGDLNNVACQGK